MLSSPVRVLAHASCVRVSCRAGRTISGSSVSSALLTLMRCKSLSVRMANRRRVERFVATRYYLPTRLRTAAPEVACEWDYDKNPMHLYPELVSVGYVEPVWWRCRVCDHRYEMSVEKRIVRGGGCARCRAADAAASAATAPSSPRSDSAATALLPGERDASLRVRRPPMLRLRTQY